MEQVEEICDHIILVNKGEKILDGSVDEIKENFKENLYKINVDIADKELSSSLFNIIKKAPSHLLLQLQSGANTNDLLKYFIDNQIMVKSFNEVLPSLNDIFIKLVEGGTTRKFNYNN